MNNLSKIGATLVISHLILMAFIEFGYLVEFEQSEVFVNIQNILYLFFNLTGLGLFFLLTKFFSWDKSKLINIGLLWFVFTFAFDIVFYAYNYEIKGVLVDLYFDYGRLINLLVIGLMLYGVSNLKIERKYFGYFIITLLIYEASMIIVSWLEFFAYIWIFFSALRCLPFVFLLQYFRKQNEEELDNDLIDV